ALGEFQIIIDKADGAEADSYRQHDPYVRVAEVGPEQRGKTDREQDHHPAHGGRAFFGHQMRLRAVEADGLALGLLGFEPADDFRADIKTDEQRSKSRAAAAEGQVAEKIEPGELFRQRNEKIIQHVFFLRADCAAMWPVRAFYCRASL